MEIAGTKVEDTFAEAFRMRYVRLVLTAHDEHWLAAGAAEFCGNSTSIIACDAEIGVERRLSPDETPDGRPGLAILAFGLSADGLAAAIPGRVGQCLMTAPTSTVFDGLAAGEEQIPLGRHIRYFGDGYQKSKLIGGRRYWRIPVMDGEFLVEDQLHVGKGVAGGNIILQAATFAAALAAAREGAKRSPRSRASSRRFPAAWPAAAARSVRATAS